MRLCFNLTYFKEKRYLLKAFIINFAKHKRLTNKNEAHHSHSAHIFVEEDKIITALFEEGLDILHLRKPETPAMYSERLLTLIPEKYHRRIVTHEHFYLKEEFDLMGIHLNTRNPNEPHDYSGHVSCTCHSVEEVKSKKHFYDYVFMSPVYDCITKTGTFPVILQKNCAQLEKKE